tara:strand:+ start:370 stop:1167 length:798 start_codon:yes stop_codon:yes gene_type:complete
MKYISFNNMGKFGRLGNSMFQYATVLGASKTNGHLPACNVSGIPLFSECFELGSVSDQVIPEELLYIEKEFSFNDRVLDIPTDRSVDLRGYFQSEKYFKHIENEVRNNFTFTDSVRNVAIEKIPEDVCVSVHVRRGDYVNLGDHHHNQSIEYYQEALEHFPDHIPVFFSDDIDWCKETFSTVKNNPIFIDNEDTLNLSASLNSDMSGYVDMCAMSFCNDHIIANSSFSWWGAWLGQGNTIAPKTWFGPSGPQDWQDIYCEGWITL